MDTWSDFSDELSSAKPTTRACKIIERCAIAGVLEANVIEERRLDDISNNLPNSATVEGGLGRLEANRQMALRV